MQTKIKRQFSEISLGSTDCSDDNNSNSNQKSNSHDNTNPLDGIMHVFSNFTRRQLNQRQIFHHRQQESAASQEQEYAPPNNTSATKNSSVNVQTTTKLDNTAKNSSKVSTKPTSPSSSPSAWRTAICPKTQKTYYWNMYTRESRWKKPLELASDEERREIEMKERAQKEFFEEMEKNILKRMSSSRPSSSKSATTTSVVLGGSESEFGGGMFGGSTLKDVATISPGTTDTTTAATEISESWTQPMSEGEGCSPQSTTGSTDWIQGWISADNQSVLSTSSSSLMDSPGRSDCGIAGIDDIGAVRMHSFSPCSLGSISRDSSLTDEEEQNDKVLPLVKKSKLERIKSHPSKPVIDKPELVRTISKMEFDLALQLNPQINDGAACTPSGGHHPKSLHQGCSTPTSEAIDILSGLHLTPEGEGMNVSLSDSSQLDYSPLTPMSESTLSTTSSFGSPNQSTNPRRDLSKPSLVTKRNTCGTIYVGTTLSAPDKDAMIKCVCGVFRAHLLQSSSSAAAAGGDSSPNLSSPPLQDSKYAVFKDCRPHGDYRCLDTQSIPSLKAITDFYRSIFLRSQMEIECIIISLIYVERLIKKSKGELRPRSDNWRSILFSCMVLASKVWDDLSMWNCDFSKIGPSGMTFSLQRTNELEVALLRALEYRVKVRASEYAKYYFLLRGMLCRSGLANDDLTRLNPLDVKGKSNVSSSSSSSGSGRRLIKRRSRSFSEYSGREESERMNSMRSESSSNTSKKISLEELVPM